MHWNLTGCMRCETFVIELKLGWSAIRSITIHDVFESGGMFSSTHNMNRIINAFAKRWEMWQCNNSRSNGCDCTVPLSKMSIPWRLARWANHNRSINKSKSLLLCQRQWWIIKSFAMGPIGFIVYRESSVSMSAKRKIKLIGDFYPS